MNVLRAIIIWAVVLVGGLLGLAEYGVVRSYASRVERRYEQLTRVDDTRTVQREFAARGGVDIRRPT